MGAFRVMGLFTVIPAAILLTISFFVLVVLHRIESGNLKVFGFIITGLLWIAALLIFSTGIYTLSTGRPPMICPIMKMMHGRMPGMMMKDKKPMMMPSQMDTSRTK